MPPTVLVDLASINLETVTFDLDGVQGRVPQRHEMTMLDRVHLLDLENLLVVGSKDVRDDEFWVRGHIPGRPLFPGVMSIEALAQACTFLYYSLFEGEERFFGFGGVDGVRFRGQIVPGDRLVLVAKGKKISSRLSLFETQGFVDGKMVVQAEIRGVNLG